MSGSSYGAFSLSDEAEAKLSQRLGNRRIDLRSDTVTQPSEAMRTVMAQAQVGDDVYGEDPTVHALEARTAKLLGKEAAVFVSSGTQANLIAMLCHCNRGDEYIGGREYHSYSAEAGGAAVLGGISPYPLDTNANGGLEPLDVHGAIKPDDSHFAISRLLCLENTVSGKIQQTADIEGLAHIAKAAGMAVHMYGARFMNAAVALNENPADMLASVDTVSLCLSKGLGAPIGSVLAGPVDFIKKAKRQRKLLGGGTRQAGHLAAAGLYALDHNIQRLSDDHRRTRQLAVALADMPKLEVELDAVQTNMLFVKPPRGGERALYDHLTEQGVVTGGPSTAMRLVLHLDVDDNDLDQVIEAFKSF